MISPLACGVGRRPSVSPARVPPAHVATRNVATRPLQVSSQAARATTYPVPVARGTLGPTARGPGGPGAPGAPGRVASRQVASGHQVTRRVSAVSLPTSKMSQAVSTSLASPRPVSPSKAPASSVPTSTRRLQMSASAYCQGYAFAEEGARARSPVAIAPGGASPKAVAAEPPRVNTVQRSVSVGAGWLARTSASNSSALPTLASCSEMFFEPPSLSCRYESPSPVFTRRDMSPQNGRIGHGSPTGGQGNPIAVPASLAALHGRSSTTPRRRAADPVLRQQSAEHLQLAQQAGAFASVAEGGSSTVPTPLAPPHYAPPTRGRSVAASGRATGSTEPEAEPSGSCRDGGVRAAGVQRFGLGSTPELAHILTSQDQEQAFEDMRSPQHTLNSAKIDTCDEESLSLSVRLMPSEIVQWSDLQIVRPINTGSFGEVFLATYKNQEVSVKRCILGQGGSMTKEQLCNLEREINTYRTLDHPSIVKYIGCVLEHPNLAIVTEYVPNGNVFDLLYTHRVNLPGAMRLKIASQVCLALCYMHSCDPIVIHRDLKTQNVILDADYSVKLCDFGKTLPLDDNCSLLLQHDDGGSPRYMAPECFRIGRYITEKVDIWSLGCCLVEVLGGPLPYEDVPQMSQVITLIFVHRQPPLVPPWFVHAIKPILARCFDFEPQERPDISEVQLVLRRLSGEELDAHGMNKRRTH